MDNRDSREHLQDILEDLMGSRNVYYQAPGDDEMHYPCIVYDLATVDAKHADNRVHHRHNKYTLTLIDPDPESIFLDKLEEFPMCSHDRRYTADHLHHDVFTLYF